MVALLLAISLAACATLPLEAPLPAPLHMVSLPGRSHRGSAMAWHPDGNQLAFAGDALKLLDIAANRVVTLNSGNRSFSSTPSARDQADSHRTTIAHRPACAHLGHC